VAPDYGDEEILSVLGFAETLGCLAALGVATISSNDPLLDLLVSKFKSWQAHVEHNVEPDICVRSRTWLRQNHAPHTNAG
jgi:hypothetical protein